MRNRIKLVVLLAVALFLGACHSEGLHLGVVAPTLPLAYREASTPIAGNRGSGKPWWRAFSDPTLDAMLERSARDNPTLEQAARRLEAARALARSAASGFDPSAGLSGLANAGTGKATQDDLFRRPAQLNLEMGWDIALFGQDAKARRTADLGVEMAATDLEAARLAIAAQVASTYTRLRALQRHRRDTDEMIALLTKSQALADTKMRSGLATHAEGDTLRLRVAAASQARQQLETAIADAGQQIATLQGLSVPDPVLWRPAPQPVASAFDIRSRPADLLRRRPDVRRAELAVLQAGADLGMARTDLYPKLHLSGMIGLGTPVAGSLFGLLGGPSVQLPIFDAGRRRDVVAARAAQLEEARASYKQAVLAAYDEASSALRGLDAARENTRRLRASDKLAARSQGSADLLLRAGLSDALGVVASGLARLDLRGQLVDAVADEAEALIRVVKATGGSPFDTPEPTPTLAMSKVGG
ncbi:TolC family protein [Aureimonas sp. AU20]|uniref:TolC family protein n=1 Tax=Aureimonas sp. AU20 TaxID=1349819 RepID=UPI00071F62E4|nr:TolC family protein [Aureimonas sp. AU20]ALN71873.1 hypothetical protein M673_04045 [Aureimonas sp. AU20]